LVEVREASEQGIHLLRVVMGKRTECKDRRRQQRRPRANGPIAHLARRDMRILDFAEQILERNTAR
jgi:hypothetical protein